MKEAAPKSSIVSAELASKLEDTLLELIAGGNAGFEHYTPEEVEQIVLKNVMENWFNECFTGTEDEKKLIELWKSKLVNRAEFEKRGGIASIWS